MGRQPVFAKEKEPSRVSAMGISQAGNNPSKGPSSKIGGKRESRFQNAAKMLVGNQQQQFDEIPDSLSHFSKATNNRPQMVKRHEPKEEKITYKPNEIIMTGNMATFKEHNFTGLKQQKEVTDKPNNIRAPLQFAQDLRF